MTDCEDAIRPDGLKVCSQICQAKKLNKPYERVERYVDARNKCKNKSKEKRFFENYTSSDGHTCSQYRFAHAH